MSVPDPGIYILTGPVRSGKTTTLLHWSEKRKDVHGILTPLAGEKRVFMNARNREPFPMEAEADESAVLSVGRFQFSKNNFDRAIGIIRDAIPQDGWLIIDEIGPLELKGEGFHDVLKEVLGGRKGKLLLVVREGYEAKVTDLFGFTAEVIRGENINAI